MPQVLRIVPDRFPRISRLEARIDSSLGLSYRCRCFRSLEFDVFHDDQVVVVGVKSKAHAHRRREIVIIQGDQAIGTIRPGIFTGVLVCGQSRYRLPTPCHPQIPELGLVFSWLALVGFGVDRVEIHDDKHLAIALALLAYQYAWKWF